MSTRAIRRLREEREAAEAAAHKSESEEEEEEEHVTGKNAAFLAMVAEESSSSSDDDSDQEDSEKDERTQKEEEDMTPNESDETEVNRPVAEDKKKQERAEEEEDLDALLAEFESQDQNDSSAAAKKTAQNSWFAVLVTGMDARDLDIDYVMRTSLLGGVGADGGPSRSSAASRRSGRLVFGAPRNEWSQHRPPHYVGGGLGMTSYFNDENKSERKLPWPYDSQSVGAEEVDFMHWFTFLRSDTYKKDCLIYERIQQTGDVNALALFVAQHPFITEALLQLCMVLYQTNQSQEGLSVLRRCLWIYECSTLISFSPLDTAKACFMDYDLKENASYFHALFRLIQVSGVAGCIRTSFAVSRYLLSLDPLRDPMGTLLLLDYYALATMSEAHDRFVVDLVGSQRIQIHYRESLSEKHHQCDLLDLPNWSYSYALALYRLHTSSEECGVSVERANEALEAAIQKFPGVVEMLLTKNEVDITGRSFQTDWPSVLGYLHRQANAFDDSSELDRSLFRTARSACNSMIQIFVKRNHKLWSGNNVLQWLFQSCESNVANESLGATRQNSIKAAFARYRQVDPADYEDRFRTLPADANPLDPNLVGPALAINPNRPRVRFFQRGMGNQFEHQGQMQDEFGQRRFQFGPPTQLIDPDSPFVEVLWRSMLPWNRVEGVPPPRR